MGHPLLVATREWHNRVSRYAGRSRASSLKSTLGSGEYLRKLKMEHVEVAGVKMVEEVVSPDRQCN